MRHWDDGGPGYVQNRAMSAHRPALPGDYGGPGLAPWLPDPRPTGLRQLAPGKRRLPRLRPGPGLVLALISFWLGLLWVAAIPPLGAPDEPAHLQAVMQVRKQHILPEVHYDFSADPQGQIVGTPADAATQEY